MSKGYHLTEIPRGVYGEWSKVEEELAEYEDAKEQGSKIMMAVELADLFGALAEFKYNHGGKQGAIGQISKIDRFIDEAAAELGITTYDLIVFSNITARVFESGER